MDKTISFASTVIYQSGARPIIGFAESNTIPYAVKSGVAL